MSDVSATLPLAGTRDPVTPAPSQPAHGKTLGIWATLGWTALSYLGFYTVFFIQKAANLWAGTPVQLPRLMYDMPIGYIVTTAVVLIAVRTAGLPLRDYLGLVSLRLSDVCRGIGIGVAVFASVLVLYATIALITLGGTLPDYSALFRSLASIKWQSLIPMFVLSVIVAPIAEELQMRGLMYRGLAESPLGAAGAIAITSIVFGLSHWSAGWERVVIAGCGGVLLGFLRWRTGGTSMPIVVHAATNATPMMAIIVMALMAS